MLKWGEGMYVTFNERGLDCEVFKSLSKKLDL